MEQQTIRGSVFVPVLQGAAIGFCVAILCAGLGGLFGAGWLLAGKLAAGGLLVGTALPASFFILQERSIRVTPALMARQAGALPEPDEPDEPEPWRIIRPYSPRPALGARLDTTVRSIEPETDPATRELHDFVCGTWGKSLSRDACRSAGFTRSSWERYVGGRRGKAGQESGRGLLDRAGCVERTSTGWTWATGIGLADVFSITPELAQYADLRARMTSDGTVGTGRDRPVSTSGTSGTQRGRGRRIHNGS